MTIENGQKPSGEALAIARARLTDRPLTDGLDAELLLDIATRRAQRDLDRRDGIVEAALGIVAARFKNSTASPGEIVIEAATTAANLALGLDIATTQGEMQ